MRGLVNSIALPTRGGGTRKPASVAAMLPSPARTTVPSRLTTDVGCEHHSGYRIPTQSDGTESHLFGERSPQRGGGDGLNIKRTGGVTRQPQSIRATAPSRHSVLVRLDSAEELPNFHRQQYRQGLPLGCRAISSNSERNLKYIVAAHNATNT